MVKFDQYGEIAAAMVMQYENNHGCFGTKFKGTADTTVMCFFDLFLKKMLNFHNASENMDVMVSYLSSKILFICG